jgi:heme exporter protein C
MMIKKWWWKFLGIALMLYVLLRGLTTEVPSVDIIEQSIRNLFFHVPMWMVMMVFLLISASFGIGYLRTQKLKYDRWSLAFLESSLLLGVAGCITGSFWAKATWGAYWPDDPKLKGVALGMLIYAALMVLRSAIPEQKNRAKIGAIYNIFVFPIFIAFIYVLPKLNPGLHPGSGDTVKFVDYNVISKDLRLVFYPAILGWGLLYGWLTELRFRHLNLIFNIRNK